MSDAGPGGARTHAGQDLAVAAAGLLAIVLWEASGWDWPLIRLYGDAAGFALRDAWWARDLLHDGGRWLARAVIVLLLVDAWRPLWPGPSRRQRMQAIATILACLVLVPALKRLSATSCPWDLDAFGGLATYVPHWWPYAVDGGPGHCFPGGHAVAAFAFFPLYFTWRSHRPGLARGLALGIVVAGGVFSWAQMARGAHFASHGLWTAWLCWCVAMGVHLWLRPGERSAAAPQHGYEAREAEVSAN